MESDGAVSTIDDRRFLFDGGCPRCKSKSWQLTSDGWVYCNNCGYGQSQDFEISQMPYTKDICPDHPNGCPDYTCRDKWRSK